MPLSLVAFSPTDADSQLIRADSTLRSFFELHPNSYSKKWRKAIKEMYRYRCAIRERPEFPS